MTTARRDAAGGGGRAGHRRAARFTRYTTNPETATGDGIAMAWRAGCRVATWSSSSSIRLSYHPRRALSHHRALRGEARTSLARWPRFMRRTIARRAGAARHRRPRHRLRDEEAWPRSRLLDARHLARRSCRNISRRSMRAAGARHRHREAAVPVVPAAHYTCGGVVTDLEGRTDLPGVCGGRNHLPGLHGANRLASNSLLECVVLGRTCASRILASDAALTRALAGMGREPVETPTSRSSSLTTGTSCVC